MQNQPECYGTMFPELSRIKYNQPLAGKAFQVLVESMGIGISKREVQVKQDAWRECVKCQSYRDCYDLSMAILALRRPLGAE